MWDELTDLVQNFSSATVEVWEWTSNFIPHLTEHMINYLSMLELKFIHVNKMWPKAILAAVCTTLLSLYLHIFVNIFKIFKSEIYEIHKNQVTLHPPIINSHVVYQYVVHWYLGNGITGNPSLHLLINISWLSSLAFVIKLGGNGTKVQTMYCTTLMIWCITSVF